MIDSAIRVFAFSRKISYDEEDAVEATSFLPDGVILREDLNRSPGRIRAYLEQGE